MLKRILCEATLDWSLHCPGPLLIKDGRYKKDEVKRGNRVKDPNDVFISRAPIKEVLEKVQDHGDGQGLSDLPFYLPGTSLRGAVRTRAEEILRSVIPEERSPETACIPFEERDEKLKSCSRRMVDQEPDPSPYAAACPACKLFGCTGTASRIEIPDADLDRSKGFSSSIRDFVGIDRFTGGAFQGEGSGGGAKVRLHVLEGAAFSLKVRLRNFEHWQLGLLAFVFRDFAEGDVGLGFGSAAKGFGRVKGEVTRITLKYRAGDGVDPLPDVGTLCGEAERCHYRFPGKALSGVRLVAAKADPLGFYQEYRVKNPGELWARSAELFHEFVEARSRVPRSPSGGEETES